MIACVREGERSLVIKKSEFIAYSKFIGSRDDVRREVDKIRSMHPDARHVCYGYIADEKGDDFGYDDNGEPSGTAGKPIYSAIEAAGVRKTLIVVVRYFGGIKLGAGGLTRAYRQSAAELIESAGTVMCERTAEYYIECGGDAYKYASRILSAAGCTVSGIVYAANVSFNVTAPVDVDVTAALAPLGITPQKTGESYTVSEGQ